MVQKKKVKGLKDKNYNNSVRIVLELGQIEMRLAKTLIREKGQIFYI